MNFEAIKKDSVLLAALGDAERNRALELIASEIQARRNEIVQANEKDLAENSDIPAALKNRLKLSHSKIDEMISGINDLVKLEDPLHKTLLSRELDKGLELYGVSVPIGVIGVIFEARPDALVQIAALCIKSGNCVILKGGSEAKHSNKFLATLIKDAAGTLLPENAITLLESRENVKTMLSHDESIDLIIPRGSNSLVKYIQENTKIPVLGHADGVCHAYIDDEVNPDMTRDVIVDAKTQYPSACNAIETILVHRNSLETFDFIKLALEDRGVTIHGCEEIGKRYGVDMVEEWHHEYGDLEVSVKVVDSIDHAIEHINRHGSGHSEVILTERPESRKRFISLIDSSSVMVNCSTRFADGFRYGFGAEVGISTNKIHARGPVGLEGLVIYKYILLGQGQVVAKYSGDRASRFTHGPLDREFRL